MFRLLRRLFPAPPPAAADNPNAAGDTTVLLLRVKLTRDGQQAGTAPSADESQTAAAITAPSLTAVAAQATCPAAVRSAKAERSPRSGPTPRRLDSELCRLRMLPKKTVANLAEVGIVTAGDLLAADLEMLSRRLEGPANRSRQLERARHLIRFAFRFSDMTLLEAALLFAVHRRSRRTLAGESAAVVRRDLERLLLSTRGRRISRGCAAPELARVRRWIEEAKRSIFGKRSDACSIASSVDSTAAAKSRAA